jgi:hypothetical protein
VTLLLALSLAGAALQAAPADSFRSVQVGEVHVVAAPARLDAAIRLAELADRPTFWPGLGRQAPAPFQLVLVADSAELGRISRGRAPSWGAAVAFPQSRTIVLRGAIRSRVPLWFDEGYATLAAGEWGRLARLELHLSVVVTGVPTLGDLDGQLRGTSQVADRAYGLAATAVTTLTARIPGNDLAPFLRRLAAGEEFTAAVQGATGRDVSTFEGEWREETRRNFRGGLWLAAGGWWLVAAGVVVAAWSLRRKRELPRRQALDVGWELPPESGEGEGEMSQPVAPIDPDRKGM